MSVINSFPKEQADIKQLAAQAGYDHAFLPSVLDLQKRKLGSVANTIDSLWQLNVPIGDSVGMAQEQANLAQLQLRILDLIDAAAR